MLEAALHGAVAGVIAFGLVLAAGALSRRRQPSRADAIMTALITFCVAAGHTLGRIYGHAGAGIAAGAVIGIVSAGMLRSRHRRPA